jgi:hypothetical protein
MADLLKTSIKELSQDMNSIQSRKKDLFKKYDLNSKIMVINEILLLKDKAKKTVFLN